VSAKGNLYLALQDLIYLFFAMVMLVDAGSRVEVIVSESHVSGMKEATAPTG